MDIPGRVLLDTNIVNFILDWGEAIHDGGEIPAHVSDRDAEDIVALRDIWLTGTTCLLATRNISSYVRRDSGDY